MTDLRSSLFGKLALATGQVSAERIKECLALQLEYEKQGRTAPRLGELLAAKGYLTVDQVKDILRRQKAAAPGEPGRAPDPVRQVAAVDAGGNPAGTLGDDQGKSGEVFGQFKIMKRLGADSAGYTYKAKFLPKDMTVTLRVLSQERMNEDPEYVRRFEQQAKAANDLKHPGIQRVVAAGRKHGRDFYAAEYLEGVSLKRILEARGRADVPFALDVAIHVAEALEYGHARGVFHQEIRPSNILITADKQVKLVAFGVAHDVMGNLKRLSEQVGDMPFYIAPEQAVDDDTARCDARTDIYCLGVVLYQMLTGEPPFKGDSVEEVLLNLAEEEVADPTLLNPAIPRALADVALAMMNPEPDQRFQTAGELLAALRKIDPAAALATHSDTVQDSGKAGFGKKPVHPVRAAGNAPLPGGHHRGRGEHAENRDHPRRRGGKTGGNNTVVLMAIAAALIVIGGIGIAILANNQMKEREERRQQPETPPVFNLKKPEPAAKPGETAPAADPKAAPSTPATNQPATPATPNQPKPKPAAAEEETEEGTPPPRGLGLLQPTEPLEPETKTPPSPPVPAPIPTPEKTPTLPPAPPKQPDADEKPKPDQGQADPGLWG